MAQKLSQKVFQLKYCPTWAHFAAVNSWGTAFYFEYEPYIVTYPDGSGYWDEEETGLVIVLDDDKKEIHFDASDWKNSLILKDEQERVVLEYDVKLLHLAFPARGPLNKGLSCGESWGFNSPEPVILIWRVGPPRVSESSLGFLWTATDPAGV